MLFFWWSGIRIGWVSGRHKKCGSTPVSLISACLCGVGLGLPCISDGSTSIDTCQAPAADSHLTIAYYDQEKSSFESGQGLVDRVNYNSDVLFRSDNDWSIGFGHRVTNLDVEGLDLQTNGYLHTFFLPVHKVHHSEGKSFRISLAPALSASSNVAKDPGEYTRNAFQLMAAIVWSRQISDRLDLSYGICGDYRLGGFQVYPMFGFKWQPDPDWKIEIGFPASQLSYELSNTVSSWLRVSPDGNEWFVKDRSLEKDSKLIYEAYVIELVFNWRFSQHFTISGSVGSEFDARYEATLLDDSRVRVHSDSAARVGVALAWLF